MATIEIVDGENPLTADGSAILDFLPRQELRNWVPIFATATFSPCAKHGLHVTFETHEGYIIAADLKGDTYEVDVLDTVNMNMKKALTAGLSLQGMALDTVAKHENAAEYSGGMYL